MNSSRELTGKIALVTGAGRGIGEATALELAQRGAHVALVARSKNEIENVALHINSVGGNATALPVDLLEKDAVPQLIAAIEHIYGAVDILVNNAGVNGPYGPLWDIDPDAWESALYINVVVPMRLTHAVLPHMRTVGYGRIINLSSGASQNPMIHTGAYSTSKAAISMFTRQTAAELQDSGISVVAVEPGIVDTSMYATLRNLPQEVIGPVGQYLAEAAARGDVNHPSLPAQLIATLAGEAGTSLSGQTIRFGSDQAQKLLRG